METTEIVNELGLYSTNCCGTELIFDAGDVLLRCPYCKHSCYWELEEELVTMEELENMAATAA